MTYLSKCLAERDCGVAVWSVEGERITLNRVKELLARQEVQVGHLAGRRVGLRVRDNVDLAIAYLLFDGRVESLLPFPFDVDDKLIESFVEGGAVEAVLTDRPIDAVNIQQERFHPAAGLAHPGSPEQGVVGRWPPPTFATHWLLLTSGTTGVPKLIRHSLSSLTRTTQRRHGATPFVWGLFYDLARFAGLQVFLQALVGGGTLVFTAEDLQLEARIEQLRRSGCDAISATPSLWRKLLMCANIAQLSLRQVTLGGEIADRQILCALRQKFPLARIVHIYASTEAGVGFAVADGKEGFPAEWIGAAKDGVDMKVGADGRLWLRIGHQETALVPEGAEQGIWVDTGDLVRQEGDRYLFLGRANGAINVGGSKVLPEEVERVILEIPEVLAVRVRGRRSSVVGHLVEAQVTLRPAVGGQEDLIQRIRSHCRARLESFKVPAFIYVSPDLPLTAAGKALRHRKYE